MMAGDNETMLASNRQLDAIAELNGAHCDQGVDTSLPNIVGTSQRFLENGKPVAAF